MKADRALAYLEAHPNEWIPVTTDETIDALRELRGQGYRIVTKFEDQDRFAKYTPPEPVIETIVEAAQRIFSDDIERVVTADGEVLSASGPPAAADPPTPPITPGEAGRTLPMRRVEDPATKRVTYELVEQTRCDCGDLYLIWNDHVHGQRHQNWLRGETNMEVAVPDPKPLYKFPEGQLPAHFEVGEVVVCPTCKNKRSGGRKNRDGVVTPVSEFTTAPGRPGRPCSNCNGNGLIPNIGTIAHGGHPSGPEPEPATEPVDGQTDTGLDPGVASDEGGDRSEQLPGDHGQDHPGPAAGKPRGSRPRARRPKTTGV